MRNSFVLYTDYEEHLELLTDEQCGILFRAIMAHQIGKPLPPMDAGVRMAFSFIRARLDKDSEAYEKKCEKNRANATARSQKREEPSASEIVQPQANASERKRTRSDNDYDNESDNDIKKKEKRFKAPSVEDVAAYCAERGNNVDPDQFVNFYESKGWKVGSSPMKDWKACVRTWEKRESERRESPPQKSKNAFNRFDQRDYDESELEQMLLSGVS